MFYELIFYEIKNITKLVSISFKLFSNIIGEHIY